jgi:hypothetical protein
MWSASIHLSLGCHVKNFTHIVTIKATSHLVIGEQLLQTRGICFLNLGDFRAIIFKYQKNLKKFLTPQKIDDTPLK